MSVRHCKRCGRDEPEVSFSAKHYWCRPCQLEYNRARTDKMTEEYRADWRKRSLMRKFGLTVDDYEVMWQAQNGLCAICNQPEIKIIKGRLNWLSVDHDHETGAVRGLLCSRCNSGIGWMQDDPELLRAAAVYLESFSPVKGSVISHAVKVEEVAR